MFNIEYFDTNYDRDVNIRVIKANIAKRFFCKRGKYLNKVSWELMYQYIKNFRLIFKISYNMTNNLLTTDYIQTEYRWTNQVQFFKKFLKIFKKWKWHKMPIKRIFVYATKAKRACYRGLIDQQK